MPRQRVRVLGDMPQRLASSTSLRNRRWDSAADSGVGVELNPTPELRPGVPPKPP